MGRLRRAAAQQAHTARPCGCCWSRTRRGCAAAVARGLRAEGFEVEVVGDGVEGYWRAKERPYGAIVLDILLPGMNGYVVCRRLRDEQVTTPILMLTAKDGEYDEAEALDLGADDFLRKPFAFVVLVARLRALQRRGGGARPPVLAAGDLRFDPRRDAASAARRRSRCRRARPRCWSTCWCATATWSTSTSCSTASGAPTPTTTPTSSRSTSATCARKIDRPFGRASLQTVRGVGYRLVDDAA